MHLAKPLEEAERLYKEELFDLARQKLLSYEPKDDQERGVWHYLMGWLEYRSKKFDLVRQHKDAALKYGEMRAWILEANLAAYVDKNIAALKVALTHLPEDSGKALSAVITMARDPSCPFTRDDIYMRAAKITGRSQDDAHCFHNAARYFLDKGDGRDDFATAIELLHMALDIYDEIGVDHHRGAAWYWLSFAYLKTNSKEMIEAAKKSLEFWEAAAEKNQGIADYKDRVVAAKQWLASLEAMLGVCPNCGGKILISLGTITCAVPGVGEARGKWQKCKGCGFAFSSLVASAPALEVCDMTEAKT
jgi:tetratricopeptide (TPR) repeat protein